MFNNEDIIIKYIIALSFVNNTGIHTMFINNQVFDCVSNAHEYVLNQKKEENKWHSIVPILTFKNIESNDINEYLILDTQIKKTINELEIKKETNNNVINIRDAYCSCGKEFPSET